MTTVVTTDVTNGDITDASVMNNNFTAVKSTVNGNIDNANISASAAIAASKLGSGTAAAGKYLDGAGTWTTLPVGGATITYATTPPGSPATGDIWYCVDATTNSTYCWAFRYNSPNTTYDWEFIGGAPGSHEVDTAQSVNSLTYIDLATVGPTFTMPRAGVYEIEYGATLITDDGTNAEQMFCSPKIGAAATSDNDAIVITGGLFNLVVTASVARSKRFTVAASDVVKLQYKQAPSAGAINASHRWLKITPVRVS